MPAIVRTAAEVDAICSSNVFAVDAAKPTHKLYVSFVLDQLAPAHDEKLAAIGNDGDSFAPAVASGLGFSFSTSMTDCRKPMAP